MKLTLPKIAIVLVTTLLSFASGAGAQSTDGQIQGVVVDIAGAPLPAVPVTIVNTETGASHTVHSDASGRFTAPAVPTGSYEATAAFAGFAPRRQENLRVRLGETVNVRFELRAALDPETLTIGDLAPVIDPARSHVATLIEQTAVTHLPIRSRNFVDLALTAGGVTRNLPTGDILISGQPSIANAVSVDGGQLLGFGAYQFSQHAIQEFRVDVNGYRAEYGRASGGVIHAITKSGTNSFHGSAIALRGGSVFSSPDLETSQLGAVLGGPIARNRHFFLVNYDILRRDLTDQNQRVFLIRTDHQLTGNDRLTFRYNDQDLGDTQSTRSTVAAVTTVFGSRFVNDARLHYQQARDVRAVNRLQIADTVTVVGGAHEVKAGFDAVGDDLSATVPFGTLTTTTFESENVSAFIQDEWQAGSALTLNIGARHDVGLFSEFSDWDPRAGVTWLSSARLAVRGSYGRFSSPYTDLRVRQASAGAEYQWMPQTTIAVNYLQGNAPAWQYRAMTFEAQRRFWQGTQYRAAYTVSNEPSRHRGVLSFVYGTDALAARFSGLVTTLLEDWTVSTVFALQSRDPRLQTTRIGYSSFDPRLARNVSLGSGRTLAFILESYNLRNRPNVLAVNDLIFPLQVGQPEGRLTQVGLRLMF